MKVEVRWKNKFGKFIMYYFNVMDTTLKEIELIDKSIKKTFMMILDEIVAIIFIKINFQNLFSFNILHG